jgi:methionine synthase II (cobalamin-independent)
VFATLAGGLPDPPSDDPDGRLRLQLEVGIEPVHDALPARVPATAIEVVVDAWRGTAAAAGSVAAKAIVPGPFTLAEADERGGRRRSRGRVMDAAERIAGAIEALAAAGCPLVQVDEPAAVRLAGSTRDRRAFRDAHVRLLAGPSVGAIHVSLAILGGDAEALGAEAIFEPPYRSYLFDLVSGPDNWRLVTSAPGERGVVCGVVPGAVGPTVTKEIAVWAAHYAASTNGRGLDRVGLATAGSLEGLGWAAAERRVRLLAEAARIAADDSMEHLATELDPRAVGMKSAALGRHVPVPERKQRRRP